MEPFTSYSEPKPEPGGKRPLAWFALTDDRPLAFFAGIWVPQWIPVRKVREGKVRTDRLTYLAGEPNREVGAIHTKAMPVILTEEHERETGMTEPRAEVKILQRPLPEESMVILAWSRSGTGLDG